MYEKTSGQNWRDNAGWMNETLGHYQWYGISCDVDGFVTNIDLRGNNLLGQFPVYKRNDILYNLSIQERPVIGELRPMFCHWMLMKDGLANLFKFKTFDLSNNKLSTIEYCPLYNLCVLNQFVVLGNQLSGEPEALVAPSLMYAYFSNNGFTSMPHFEKHKLSSFQTLWYCEVSNNAIKGDVIDLLRIFHPTLTILWRQTIRSTESFQRS
jgi:hypothetical protein